MYSPLHLQVISSISKLNQLSSSLRLCFHIPLKRDQWDWDWRMRSNDTPNAIGCISESPNFHTSFHVCKRSPQNSKDLSRKVRYLEIHIFKVCSPPWVASESHKKRRCVRKYLLRLLYLIWYVTILVTQTRVREYLLRLLYLQIWLITILAIKKRLVRGYHLWRYTYVCMFVYVYVCTCVHVCVCVCV